MVVWRAHLWNASRFPSAVMLVWPMQDPDQFETRRGFPMGWPVFKLTANSQKLHEKCEGLSASA
jgi:hypothetical protein